MILFFVNEVIVFKISGAKYFDKAKILSSN